MTFPKTSLYLNLERETTHLVIFFQISDIEKRITSLFKIEGGKVKDVILAGS